jgi:hypothetical protein
MRYFIVITRKNSNKTVQIYPIKRGMSLNKVKANLRRNLNPKYRAKIINEMKLRMILRKLKKRA